MLPLELDLKVLGNEVNSDFFFPFRKEGKIKLVPSTHESKL